MDRYSNLGDPDEVPEEEPEEQEAPGRFSEEEMEDGFDVARFCYLFNFFGVPFFLIPLFRKDNAFSLFHAKQAAVLWAVFVGSLLTGWGLLLISLQALWCFVLGGGAALTMNVVGYQRVMVENADPLPGVGRWAEEWFRNFSMEEIDGEDSRA